MKMNSKSIKKICIIIVSIVILALVLSLLKYSAMNTSRNYCYDAALLFELNQNLLPNTFKSYSEIQMAEKDENKIYIYTKCIHIVISKALDGKPTCYVGIYSYPDRTPIGDKTYKQDSDITDNAIKSLYQEYQEQLKTYKSTFEQTQNGEYNLIDTSLATDKDLESINEYQKCKMYITVYNFIIWFILICIIFYIAFKALSKRKKASKNI